MEMIVQMETVSYAQDSVNTCDCYFSIPQKQSFKSASLEVLVFSLKLCDIFSKTWTKKLGLARYYSVIVFIMHWV